MKKLLLLLLVLSGCAKDTYRDHACVSVPLTRLGFKVGPVQFYEIERHADDFGLHSCNTNSAIRSVGIPSTDTFIFMEPVRMKGRLCIYYVHARTGHVGTSQIEGGWMNNTTWVFSQR